MRRSSSTEIHPCMARPPWSRTERRQPRRADRPPRWMEQERAKHLRMVATRRRTGIPRGPCTQRSIRVHRLRAVQHARTAPHVESRLARLRVHPLRPRRARCRPGRWGNVRVEHGAACRAARRRPGGIVQRRTTLRPRRPPHLTPRRSEPAGRSRRRRRSEGGLPVQLPVAAPILAALHVPSLP